MWTRSKTHAPVRGPDPTPTSSTHAYAPALKKSSIIMETPRQHQLRARHKRFRKRAWRRAAAKDFSTCPICLDACESVDGGDVVVLACDHMLHGPCYSQYKRQYALSVAARDPVLSCAHLLYGPPCPLCRMSFPMLHTPSPVSCAEVCSTLRAGGCLVTQRRLHGRTARSATTAHSGATLHELDVWTPSTA